MPWPSRVPRSRWPRTSWTSSASCASGSACAWLRPGPRSVAHAVRHNRPQDAVDGARGGRPAPDLPAGDGRPLPHLVAGRAGAPLFIRGAADRQPAPLLEGRMAGRSEGGSGLAAKTTFGDFIRRQLIRWRGADRQRRIGDVTLWSSERGRRFPTKAWDEAYFQLLADSEHVLCPSSDYQWSVPLLRGVPLRRRPHRRAGVAPVRRFPLSADDRRPRRGVLVGRRREHNYRACAARIVVPVDALDGELNRLAICRRRR